MNSEDNYRRNTMISGFILLVMLLGDFKVTEGTFIGFKFSFDSTYSLIYTLLIVHSYFFMDFVRDCGEIKKDFRNSRQSAHGRLFFPKHKHVAPCHTVWTNYERDKKMTIKVLWFQVRTVAYLIVFGNAFSYYAPPLLLGYTPYVVLWVKGWGGL